MKRLNSFTLTLKTGPRGRETLPKVFVNQFDYELENIEGGTGAHETLSGGFNPHRPIHRFVLEGPKTGYWDIEDVRLQLVVQGREPYEVHLGAVTLDAHSDLNLWYPSPQDVFEV